MPLIAIVGATGTGKSEFALELVERFAANGHDAEVVNADAMQLYRGMNIGTAKLSITQRRGITHHLLDVLDVRDEASAAAYQLQARAAVDDIIARGATALLVGGSGLYVSSVIHDFRFPGTDAAIRARLETELVELGPGLMHQRLRAIDPMTADAVDALNGRRVVRALEVIELTGEPKAARLPEVPVAWRSHQVVHLRGDRASLIERLDRRVEQMWRDGLVEEIASLVPQGIDEGTTARRAIGYAQGLAQLRGESSEAEAIEQTQRLTRAYARRQVSWFKRYPRQLAIDTDAGAVRDAELARLATVD